MKAIKFTNTSVNEIRIDDSSRYPPDKFLYEDDPSRQYQVDSDISYYVIPHGRSHTELTLENHVPKVIVPNKHGVPLTEYIEDPPDLINTEGTYEQNVQDDQMINQPTDIPSGNNTKVSRIITKSLVHNVTQSHIPNQASTSSYPAPQDRWLRDQHIELVNIIGNPGKGMLTRSMVANLTAASARELARMESIRIFLAFATYMNFKVYQMDVKSAFLNGKQKEEVYVKQPPGFESSEFPNYVCKLDKTLYGLKQVLMISVQSKESHLTVVKRILGYLKGTPTLEKAPQVPVKYLNFLKEFWSTAVTFYPFPSTDEPEKRPLKEFLIKFLVLNGKQPLTLDFQTFCSSTGLDYNNGKYGEHPTPENFLKEFWSTVGTFYPFPSTDEPEKRPLKEFLIKFLVLNGKQPLTLDFQTFCSSTGLDYNNGKYGEHPTPEGPEASGALSKKSKRHKSKKPPTKTKVTPPKPIEASKQSHSVFSGTKPDPQDLERDIQLASTGLPSTHDEGTRKSKSLPEDTTTHPQDLGENKQPLDMDITVMTPDEGTAKTTPHPEGSLGDKDSWGNKPPADMEPLYPTNVDLSRTDVRAIIISEDEAQESEEDILGASDEMDNTPQSDETQHHSSPPQGDKPTSPTAPHAEASDTNSSSDNILKKITKDQWEKHEEADVHYANLKASIDDYYNENITHEDKNDQLVKDSMSSFEKAALQSLISIKAWMSLLNFSKISAIQSKMILITLTFSIIDTPANVTGENATHTSTKESLSRTKRATDSNIQDKPEEPKQSTNENDQRKLVKASSIVRLHLDEPVRVEFVINGKTYYLTEQEIQEYWDKEEKIKKAEEEARLNDIRKTKVIKVVREEAKKIVSIKKRKSPPKLVNSLRKLMMLNMRSSKDNTLKRLENLLSLESTKPEYRIFFINEFGDRAFQRWSDIDKVGMEALVLYLVAAFMVKSPENARFSMKLRKLISEHPDKEKLKLNKVKLEALGYKLD
uniref:Retrovirus-related Pol polyprotein from transposon TNT 1-94 n=1 Tax=Tanacetum cinerariifolium TaxID=118510 RepID=A0A6L2JQC2_TANCI|nr:retrovirus-related Pol polyprotein from transposon TNT 1-94 [Tanacetum cinerariifolium]